MKGGERSRDAARADSNNQGRGKTENLKENKERKRGLASGARERGI